MDNTILRKIISGIIRIRIEDQTYIISNPNSKDSYLAELVYVEALEEAKSDGILSDEDMLKKLVEKGVWTDKDQRHLDNIYKDIEDAKLSIFENRFHSGRREANRTRLAQLRSKHSRLIDKRYAYYDKTAEGCASYSRDIFIIKRGINHMTGVEDGIQQIFIAYKNESYDSEEAIRKIARSPKWSSLFSLREVSDLFGYPICDWSESQVTLCSWSMAYSNAFSHSEFPSSIVDDNDLFDGWMIAQRRKAERENFQVNNQKINTSQEIMLPASSMDDAKSINRLNDFRAKAIKQQRFKAVKEKQNLKHAELPDVRQELMTKFNQLTSKYAKGR